MQCPLCGYQMSNRDLTCPRCRGTGQLQAPPVAKKSLSPLLIIGLVFGAFSGFVLLVIMVLTVLGGKVKSDFETANASVPTNSAQAPALAPIATPAIAPIPIAPEVIQSNEPPPPALPRPIDSQMIPVAPAPSRQVANPSRNTRNVRPRAKSKFSRAEANYVDSTLRIADMFSENLSLDDADEVFFAQFRSNVARCQSQLRQTPVPPRFVRANAFMKAGLNSAESTLANRDAAIAAGTYDITALSNAMSSIDVADSQMEAGYDEISRVIANSR